MVEAESGTMCIQGKERRSLTPPPEARKRQGRILPQSLLGECSPVISLISDFWPANPRDDAFLLF